MPSLHRLKMLGTEQTLPLIEEGTTLALLPPGNWESISLPSVCPKSNGVQLRWGNSDLGSDSP